MIESNPEFLQLMQACREAPTDDAPRLILSDWLEEAGELSWAEFIRISIDAAHHPTAEKTHVIEEMKRTCCLDWMGTLPLATAKIYLENTQKLNDWLYNVDRRFRLRSDTTELTPALFEQNYRQYDWDYERGLLIIEMDEKMYGNKAIKNWLHTRYALRVFSFQVRTKQGSFCGLERAGINLITGVNSSAKPD